MPQVQSRRLITRLLLQCQHTSSSQPALPSRVDSSAHKAHVAAVLATARRSSAEMDGSRNWNWNWNVKMGTEIRIIPSHGAIPSADCGPGRDAGRREAGATHLLLPEERPEGHACHLHHLRTPLAASRLEPRSVMQFAPRPWPSDTVDRRSTGPVT